MHMVVAGSAKKELGQRSGNGGVPVTHAGSMNTLRWCIVGDFVAISLTVTLAGYGLVV